MNATRPKVNEMTRRELEQEVIEARNAIDLVVTTNRLEDMTEPELREHLNRKLRFLKAGETPDTVGTMLIIFQTDGICQYGATLDPETTPQALRELATRLEQRETVKR